MILVDSSIWIDHFNGHDTSETDSLDRMLGNYPVAIGDLILTEVLQGFKNDEDHDTARRLFGTLSVFEMLGERLAYEGARNFRFLRKKGITIRKINDVIIATFCIDRGLPLLFSDKDFNPFVTHLGLIRG